MNVLINVEFATGLRVLGFEDQRPNLLGKTDLVAVPMFVK